MRKIPKLVLFTQYVRTAAFSFVEIVSNFLTEIPPRRQWLGIELE